ncbi:RNA-binding protein [Paenibacillus sp. FA6]|uniref:RNA-binding protein n=1 Tax=Paenibacillus sp. FA6 TaxID=3413029 RepID=UPI003F654E20
MINEQDFYIYQWPDLAFYHHCLKRYRLNRGIYNTMDQWFHDNGYPEIQQRRMVIIEFLECTSIVHVNEHYKYLSFGKGNLMTLLSSYVSQCDVVTQIVK